MNFSALYAVYLFRAQNWTGSIHPLNARWGNNGEIVHWTSEGNIRQPFELAGIEFADPKKYVKEKVYGYVKRRIGPSDWAFLVAAVMFGVVIGLELLYVVSDFASYIATLIGTWTHHLVRL